MNNPSKDTILSLEYNYIVDTIRQANEDRIKIFEYFTANIISIIGSFTLFSSNQQIGLLVISLLLAFGITSFLKIIKSRNAWYESVVALNKIKDFYIKQTPDIAEAFLWRINTIPKPAKKFSISFILAAFIALLNTVNVGIILTLLSAQIGLVIVLAIASLAVHYYVWEKSLNK